MKDRALGYLSVAGHQLAKLVAPDAANYTSSFRGSFLLAVGGGVAQISNSTGLAYFLYALSAAEALVGARQAVRFFAAKPEVATPPAEEFHDVIEDEAPAAVAKIKKMQ